MLSVDHIYFAYNPSNPLIDGIDFEVNPSEVVTIVGASGAGKSTLLKCISGFLELNSGEVFLEGKKVCGPDTKLVAGHSDIALVNQSFTLDEYFTTEENIKRKLLHLSYEVQALFLEELITLLDLESVRKLKSKSLSGGEKQRLSMACAIAQEPKVLLLDEPFSHLDVHLRKKVGRYIKEMCRIRNTSVILVTHEGEEALAWSNRILFLEKGKIKSIYTPESAYLYPKNLKEGRYFGELNSVYINKKQVLFRPNHYLLKGKEENKIAITFIFAEFRGVYYANFYRLKTGKEIVLYNKRVLNTLKFIYAQ